MQEEYCRSCKDVKHVVSPSHLPDPSLHLHAIMIATRCTVLGALYLPCRRKPSLRGRHFGAVVLLSELFVKSACIWLWQVHAQPSPRRLYIWSSWLLNATTEGKLDICSLATGHASHGQCDNVRPPSDLEAFQICYGNIWPYVWPSKRFI